MSEADKAYFHECMQKWQVLLNLMDWRIVYDPKPSKYMAEMFDFEPEHKLVKYRIGDNWKNAKVTPISIEQTAIHELLHVRNHAMLAAVAAYGEDSEQVTEAEHAQIIVLEQLLLRLALYEAHSTKD